MAATSRGTTDERPYGEDLWKMGQSVYFKLLEMESGKTRVDTQTLDSARKFCDEADGILREHTGEDYDDFVERVWVSEQFYSDSSRMKKSELYLKQLFLRKNRIEQLTRTLGR